MNTLDQEREETRKNVSDIIDSMHADEKRHVLFNLILKRRYDGLNGREWDASEHLAHERAVARFLDDVPNYEAET